MVVLNSVSNCMSSNKKKGRNEGGKVKRNKGREGVRKERKGRRGQRKNGGKNRKKGKGKERAMERGRILLQYHQLGDTEGLTGLGVWLKG